MASRNTRKTWETAFLLSASMSSSYQQTFDQARAILKDLGMENVQLGDEAERAAQRQENAITMAAAAIAEAGLTELLGGIKNAYTEIIQTTSEFEYTMSAVEAISGAAANEVAELEEKARTLGETTVYTARESAQAMTYMAQAGWDTTEMLEGMDGVISLAAASGTDLAEASSIVADTLAGFGMQANETGRLADVLAQTASRTNTNVSMMGQAFSYSAAVAGALGFEIEDVAAMMGLMANAGIKGSKAGTALRNIMNGLAKDVSLTSKAFGEVNVSMFDENGDSKGLVEFVRELRGYFDQMAKNEKIASAQNIATKRGYNGLLAILNATDKQFEEIYEDIQNADGAAKKMAETRLDNFQGDVTLLKSAFESLKITIGEELTPTGRDLVGWLTEVTQGINRFIEWDPFVVTGITEIVVGLGAAAGALALVAGAIKAIQAIKIVGALMGGAPGIIAAIAGIGAMIGFTIYKIHKEKEEIESLSKAQEEYIAAAKEQEQAYRDTVAAIGSEARNTEYLEAKLNRLVSIENKTAANKKEILATVELLNEKIPGLALAYNAEADSLNRTADAIRNQIRAELERERMEADYAELKRRIGEQEELESRYFSLGTEYSRASNDYEKYLSIWNQVYDEYGNVKTDIKNVAPGMTVKELKSGIESSYARSKDAGKAFEEIYAARQENNAEIERLSKSISDYESAYAGAAAEEAAGQEQINEAASAAEDAGSFDVMNYFKNGSFSTEDVSADYEGAVTPAGGNVNVVTNITVEGNATEETAEEIGAVVEEKIVSFLEKEERRRDRMLYTGE